MNPVNGFHVRGPAHAAVEQHARPEHREGPERDPPEIYFGLLTDTMSTSRRASRSSTSAGRDQQRHLLSGHGRHRTGRISPPRSARLRARRSGQAALQRRRQSAEPPVDAEKHSRARRNLAPFLTFDQDPYIVVGDDGRLSWVMDAFTTSEQLSLLQAHRPGRAAPPSTTCATASRR